MTDTDVTIVGGGVAGLTAGVFTARAGLDTVVIDGGESILRRNAILENFPGFPAGVDSRLFLEMTRDQAERAGCEIRDGTVTAVAPVDGAGTDDGSDGASARFAVAVDAAGDESGTGTGEIQTAYALCTSWADTDHLADLDVGLTARGSKTYVDVDDGGRTGVEGLYAAGRIAETHHQAIVAAGDAAAVALTLIDDSEIPFYHDWVAPEGYFTGRGREVPPGCEEIDEDERRRRESEARAVMSDYFARPADGEPTMHPSVADSDGD